ncbi:O-antigen ligase family protein [Halomonas dongshanensis]|uniref:O-antigen ligase family protein n=1 Tax=Halomonas dongshanensis TaxID=2890835 RepID=A0ABT2EBS8_9GAMM|nr:O-antigen ligase [Halomonas dongshanensis]MCS2609038.1 O-antigen ligase family protein [Halomonas dongshanensis]
MLNTARWATHYTSLAAFLFGALSLVIPTGYSLGAVLLLLGGVALLFLRPRLHLDRKDYAVIAVMLAYSIVVMLMAWWGGESSRALDRPSRFMLAVPALLFVLAYPPRLAWLWSGFAVGAIAAGSWAAWQKLFSEVERAGGYTHVIQFGNLSMLLGILCMAGLGWAFIQRQRAIWTILLITAAFMGVLGSLMSGSRGGWVGFPLMLLVLYRSYGQQFPLKIKLSLVGLVVLMGAGAFFLPQTGIQDRVVQGINDITWYLSGDSQDTSLGARFEMWKGASHLIAEKPLLGWGEIGYQEGMAKLVAQNIVSPVVLQFGHAHNEFFDAFAKRGIVGLAILLMLYLVPMRLFGRYLHHTDLNVRSIAVAGVLLSVAYIDFGFSQVFLSHNSGVMVFAFLLAILWGIHSHQKLLIGKSGGQ